MQPALLRTGPTPIYKQIEEWVRQQIISGVWPEHYKLSSETDLAAKLQVSRGTIRKAIAELISQGLLVQIHGRGTFVSSRTLESPLAERLLTFSDDLLDKNIPFETRVLETAVITPGQRVLSLLSIPPSGRAFYLKRLRIVADTTRVLLCNYVVYDFCHGIERVDFTVKRLFETLERNFKLQLDWGRRCFQAQAAPEDVAPVIGVQPGEPVMYMEQIAYLRDGSPIEMSDMWVSGAHFRLSAIVKRHVWQARDPIPPYLWQMTDEFIKLRSEPQPR